MSPFSKRYLPLFLILGVLMLTLVRFASRTPSSSAPESEVKPTAAESGSTSPALAAIPEALPEPATSAKPPLNASLSMLATLPDWRALDVYQNTLTREEFERLLTTVFTTGDAWKAYMEISENEVRIQTGNSAPDDVYHFQFASTESARPQSRHWRSVSELPPTTPELPLAALKIAIDAGHIGGEWAKMEERWFTLGEGATVEEGTMTLLVAKRLKSQLEARGARVTLVRESLEPVTQMRPETLGAWVTDNDSSVESPAKLRKLAELLFYRTAEIRARAELVNRVIRPDFVICLHFNAAAWGDPTRPTLVDASHFHLLLNGAYTDDEVRFADQRHALLLKLLQRTHQEEVLLGTAVAERFAEISGLPAYTYSVESKTVRAVAGQPYLWVRNLLANRLYECPVIYMEPYVMNSILDYARIQAGDYEGLRNIEGKMRSSIFREYADGVTAGLVAYAKRNRVIID